MKAEMDSIDVAALERAGETLIRLGATQSAIELFAMALRVRASLGIWRVEEERATERCIR